MQKTIDSFSRSRSSSTRNATPTLKELLKNQDIAVFFRFVKEHNLRTQALHLLETKIRELQMN